MNKGRLYIVPTPIGNLEDITLRAKRILSEVDLIACEDTRQTAKLLKLIEVEYKQLTSYHEHNEKSKSEDLAKIILEGKSIALVSDAGTPSVSDPGYRLVNEAKKNKIKIEPLAGASAFLMALVASGFPTDKFIFLGFPPHKKGRKTFIENLLNYEVTKVVYESPYRIIKFLKELIQYGNSEFKICVAREISKLHEEFITGSVSEVLEDLELRSSIKGEFVVIIE